MARQLHTFDWPFKVTKWPLVIWNTLLNMCTWNSFVIYKFNKPRSKKDYRNFLESLAIKLTDTQAAIRTRDSPLKRPRDNNGNIVNSNSPVLTLRHFRVHIQEFTNSRRTAVCGFCKKRLTSHICWKCSQYRIKYICRKCSATHREKRK